MPQKRWPALVSVLPSLAATEIANALHLRDFRSHAIFEFFNTIGTKRTWRDVCYESIMRARADIITSLAMGMASRYLVAG
jgi:hypothetical protein